ncbi:putative S-phase kinase-associated protein 1 [Blattamonas nauphoetae]|uniref:S-phase kinase-associated protein 1 n=1 Tax=Blattamonas nauphoetae TaxID=2049346 RepID=A0ABQ9XNW3_9EUKA|nr:putative S-phase kinase-associated protein 1 [Blattamonas nauphoetae]
MESNITLRTSDDKILTYPRDTLRLSLYLNRKMTTSQNIQEIHLEDIHSQTMRKVYKFCEDKSRIDRGGEMSDKIDTYFVQFLDMKEDLFFSVVAAASFLEIEPLLDLLCQRIAVDMKGHDAKHLRSKYHIENDLTTDQVKEIKQKRQWMYK